MTNATKITVMLYLIFVQYMKHRMQNADNARTLWIWFDNKLREVYAANDL